MNLMDNPDALAAYGALKYEAGTPLPLHDLPEPPVEILKRHLEAGYARVRLGGELDVDQGDADALALAWQTAAHTYPGDETGRAIRVRLELTDGGDWTAPYQALRRATAVSSVFLADYTCSGRRQWHWPVRVATVPGDPLRDRFGSYGHPDLIELTDITDRYALCDIAVVQVPQTADAARFIGPSLVVLYGVDPQFITLEHLREVAAQFEASAVAATTGPNNGDEFTWRFFDGLAHNHPPDLAFGMATADTDYLLIGDAEFVDSAARLGSRHRVASCRRGRLGERPARAPGDEPRFRRTAQPRQPVLDVRRRGGHCRSPRRRRCRTGGRRGQRHTVDEATR